jgi:hypothetical protein
LQKAVRDAKAAREQQINSESKQIGPNNANANPQHGLAISADEPGYSDSSENKTGSGILSNFRQRFKPSSSTPSSPPKHLDPPPLLPPRLYTNGSLGIKDPMTPYSQGPKWKADQDVTPHANIERTVRAAIEVLYTSLRAQHWLSQLTCYSQGCKAEKNSVVRSQAQLTRVKEAMDEGYCDTVGAMVRVQPMAKLS